MRRDIRGETQKKKVEYVLMGIGTIGGTVAVVAWNYWKRRVSLCQV